MAHISYDYKFVQGPPGDALASELGDLSAAGGWNVAQMTALDARVVVLLKREKDYEVAQSLQEVFAQPIASPAEAISRTTID